MQAVVSETKEFDLINLPKHTGRIVFIDPAVSDYQSLVAGVVAGTEVVFSTQQGME